MSTTPSSQPGSAKIAISALVETLQFCGVTGLDAETVRQAKFNGATAVPALWRALHDLVLVHLTDYCFEKAGPALARLWAELQEEQMATDVDGTAAGMLPHEGQEMVVHYLRLWCCPAQLCSSLQEQQPVSARHLLLALTWLVVHGRAFQRAMQALAATLPPAMALLLPPLPEDTSLTPAAQSSYSVAVGAARAHVERVLQNVRTLLPGVQQESSRASSSQARTATPPRGPFDPNPDEHQAWVAVEAASHSALTMMGRVRARINTLCSQEDGRRKLQAAVREAAAATQGSTGLSAYEVMLGCSPKAQEEAMEALETGTRVLQDTQQLASAARLFFLWAGSVLDLEQKEAGPPAQAAAVFGAAGPPLRTLQQLPDASSPAAERLLAAQEDALRIAVAGARPQLDAARFSMYTQPAGRKAVPTATPPELRVDIQHFQLLAQQAVAHTSHATDPVDAPRSVSRQSSQTSGSGREDPAWQLPKDVTPKIEDARARFAEAMTRDPGEVVQVLRVGSLPCVHFAAPPSIGRPQPQAASDPLQEAVSAADETSRLLDTVLGVARVLARTRAANKQALQLVLKELPDSYLLVNT